MKHVTEKPAPHRERILDAAFDLWMEKGYGNVSTLDIASRARISKREIYALFGEKEEMLSACVTKRVGAMRLPLQIPAAVGRRNVAAALDQFGATVLEEICRPRTIAVYRLAIIEAVGSPQAARAFYQAGPRALRAALIEWFSGPSIRQVLRGNPTAMAQTYFALLFADILLPLLLGVAAAPTRPDMLRHSRTVTKHLLLLNGGKTG